MQPTAAAASLAEQLAMTTADPHLAGWLAASDNEVPRMAGPLLSRLMYLPAHDEFSTAGVSSRILPRSCYAGGPSVIISHHQSSSAIISHRQSSSTIIGHASHHQPSSAIIHHHQPSSTITSHRQSASVIASHHQPSSAIASHRQPSSVVIAHHSCYAGGAADIATAVSVRIPTDPTATQALRLTLTTTAAKAALTKAIAAATLKSQLQPQLQPQLRSKLSVSHKVGARSVPPPGVGPSPNDLLQSLNMSSARQLVLDEGCRVQPRAASSPTPRPLNWLLRPADVDADADADADADFPIASACESDKNLRALCEILRRTAINREVLAAVSNKNIHPMLKTFLVGLRKSNITNAVVVALDAPTDKFARSVGAASYLRQLVARSKTTDNHATSGLKFAVLREFITVGCSVLLSDVDVVWVQNPFTLPSLYRDVDVEGMTDGWDDVTAYGYLWRSVGGDRIRLSARNSGLFFLQATGGRPGGQEPTNHRPMGPRTTGHRPHRPMGPRVDMPTVHRPMGSQTTPH